MEYRRVFVPGGCYFFTVVTNKRQPIFAHIDAIDLLKNAFQWTKKRYPFTIEALVILPDHLHSIWTLPINDSNFPIRWNLIKGYFSKNWSPKADNPTLDMLNQRREKEIWQHRYWEHFISDEKDFYVHMEYVHNNPVKHGLVRDPLEWKFSTIHRYHRK